MTGIGIFFIGFNLAMTLAWVGAWMATGSIDAVGFGCALVGLFGGMLIVAIWSVPSHGREGAE